MVASIPELAVLNPDLMKDLSVSRGSVFGCSVMVAKLLNSCPGRPSMLNRSVARLDVMPRAGSESCVGLFFSLEPCAVSSNGRRAFSESPKVGRGNPSHSSSVEIIGRVACAHVQPATVKAHAPDCVQVSNIRLRPSPERT